MRSWRWSRMLGVMDADAPTAYLARLDDALVGPRRARRSLVREAADHLDDAVEALVDAGHEPAEAARRAVADFGSVEEVAPAFQETLAVAASRRTAVLLLLALGVQPFLWDKGLSLAAQTHAGASASPLYGAIDEAIELGGGLALGGALMALLATGVGLRWTGHGSRVARVVGTFALGVALVVPALCLLMTAMGGAPVVFWLLMTGLMLVPLTAVALSARQTLAAA